MTPEGNYLLARAMFAEIAAKMVQGSQVSDPLSEAECERLVALTRFDRWRLGTTCSGACRRRRSRISRIIPSNSSTSLGFPAAHRRSQRYGRPISVGNCTQCRRCNAPSALRRFPVPLQSQRRGGKDRNDAAQGWLPDVSPQMERRSAKRPTSVSLRGFAENVGTPPSAVREPQARFCLRDDKT